MVDGPLVDPAAPTLSEAFGLQTPTAEPSQDGKLVERTTPVTSPSRAALIKAWSASVKQAKAHWGPAFKRMKEDQDFAAGLQWSKDRNDDRYVANIVLRHIEQRVASLYAKNPKATAKKRKRITNTVWDGNAASLKVAMDALGAVQAAMQPQMDPMTGAIMPPMPPDQTMMAASQQAMMIVQDAAKVHDYNQQLDRIAETLQLLYQYNIDEQIHPFKTMMKMMVRRAVTTGVGYVKLGFQRVMEPLPEIEARIADTSQKLATVERLSADVADGEIKPDAAEVEQLRLTLQDLQKQQMMIVREGLIFDFPLSTSIIPDPKCVHLREFLGCDWVAQEYLLSPDEIKEIYKVDVGKGFTSYKRPGMNKSISTMAASYDTTSSTGDGSPQDAACVWEIYNKKDGLVYVVCDGYMEFLREPASPDVMLERFYPWFAFVLNETDNEDYVYPPSDVRLIMHQQKEYNRMREGVREHRMANRPTTVVANGALDDDDKNKLQERPANSVIELNGLQPGQKVEDLLQPLKPPPLDPNMYEVNGVFEDILKTVGTQEANLGGTSSATATETNIAQASMTTSLGSNIDDINDVLTQLARSAGQVLLLNVSKETVMQLIGEGAVWPELDPQTVVQEIYLEIEANSTGRPNQAEEIANAERIVPLLLQIPGISPEFLARELLRRMDDRLDLTEAFSADLPSVVAMNAMKGMSSPGGGAVPGAMAQGPAGAANAGKPPPMSSQVGRGGPPAGMTAPPPGAAPAGPLN
jgi:hypothetical protein